MSGGRMTIAESLAVHPAGGADAGLEVRVLDDPARGRRRVVLGDDGLPVRIDLADGTSLRIDRDDRRRAIAVVDDTGAALIALQAIGDADRGSAARPRAGSRAANLDGSHRLSARDSAGVVTTADVSDDTTRLEREGHVLRIDSDPDGRPLRVTLPGCPTDLEYRGNGAGCWEIGAQSTEPMIRITVGPDASRYDLGGERGWTERVEGGGIVFEDLDGAPLAQVGLDPAGRIVSKRWHGGSSHQFERDEHGRLVRWTSVDPHGPAIRNERRYRDGELSETVTDGRRTVVRTDAGGRITRLLAPRGTVSCGYDANGRRVSRSHRGAQTGYQYDALGQLTEVRGSDGRLVRFGWDGLGRRVWVESDGRRWQEHRDPAGRLWSVTDDREQLVHAFIWWEGRVLARTDSRGAIDEVYLTDPVGTLMGVGRRAADRDGWSFEDAAQPPFGRVEQEWRPTLFGHIADGCTGLICFGARELDPETGHFLTPDPWHGELDDPRRVAGHSAPEVVLAREAPIEDIHAYALSQGDPLSRPDVDGHFAWGNFLLTLILGSTWGFPLTSLSVFLFLPLNIYIEVVSLIIGLIRWGHPWPQHSMFTMRLLSGSSHLGTFALALNGFLPRAAAGVGEDRCITIGYVVWENRRYFNMLDRARVLELDDVRGTPLADGKPSADGRKLSDTPQGSVLAVIGTDTDHRVWIHGTWWTRGPGNAVDTRGGGVAGVQCFEDRVTPGTAHARGTVFLAQPIPEDMPAPQDPSDSGQLEIVEYGAGAGSKTSTGVLVQNLWFAFVVEDSGLAANTVIEIRTDGPAAPAYGKILRIVATEDPVAILDHELPVLAPPRRPDSIKLRAMTASTITSANWAVGAGTANRSLTLAAPGHVLAVADVFEFGPSAPGGTIPATPERPKVYSQLAKVVTTVQLAPSIATLALNGAALFRMTTDGTALNGNVPDPAARPAELTIAGDQPLVVGDLVAVQPTAPAGAATHYGSITAVVPAVPAVPPAGGAAGTPAVPAKLTIDPPFALPAATAVRVTRLKETNRTLDTGTNAVQAAGDLLSVDVRSSDVFAVDHAVKIEGPGGPHIRRVAAIASVAIETVDDLNGTAPYTLTKYNGSGSTIDSKLSSSRFVKHTGGDRPSTYGNYPAEMMGLVPVGYPRAREPMGWRFFINSSPPPANLHPSFRDFWEPLTLGTDEYWLLRSELKIVDDGATHYWEPDRDDTYPRRHRQSVPIPTAVTVRGFAASGARRPDPGGGKVFAFPAETQVPDSPLVRWTLADALADHELSHTVQNTYWGPLLGALPLGGLLHTVRDVVEASGEDPPDWMEPVAADLNFLELFSMGGIMQLAWTYVILAPALGNEKAREYLTTRDFDDWAHFINPINRKIINAIPPVDRNVPETQDWKHVLGNFVSHALDLRSWIPLLGFVRLLTPDSPRNFLEQQASRWSGDLYSTILTADDRFNVELSFFGNDLDDANLTKQVGGVVRLMSYYADALARNMRLDVCDAPGSHLTQLTDNFSSGSEQRLVNFEQVGAGDALVPAELYEHVGGSPAPVPIQIDGPTPAGGGARPTAAFLLAPIGCILRPNLRSIVPIPPAVMRAVGFYLVGASPAKWKVSAYDDWAGTPDDPHTAVAEITFASSVKLGDEDVVWSAPFATGTPATAPPATLLERFVTEKEPLTVSNRNTSSWTAEADPGSGIALTPRAGGRGWDVVVARPAGGVALPHDARVRIWARIGKDDTAVFDLHHDGIPSLRGRRNYLEEDLWIPVRDFVVRVKDIPPLPPKAFNAADHFDLDVEVKLTGRASIVPTGALVEFERTESVPPRGERWRFRKAGRKAVEAAQVVPVTVRFGSGAGTVDRRFDLTVNPNFTIDKLAVVPAYEVTPAAPLVLTVNGGAGGFSVVDNPPAAARTRVEVAGATITLTVDPPPVPPGPARAPVNYVLVVKDSDNHLGMRTITIRP